jgi:hypothetical protein
MDFFFRPLGIAVIRAMPNRRNCGFLFSDYIKKTI